MILFTDNEITAFQDEGQMPPLPNILIPTIKDPNNPIKIDTK